MSNLVYLLWLVSIGVFPFFQGGYFYFELLFFGLIQLSITGWLIYNKKIRIRTDGFRFWWIVLMIASLFVWPISIDRGMHLFGIMRILIPGIVIVNMDSFHSYFHRRVEKDLMETFILSGTLMAIVLCGVILGFPSDSKVLHFFVQGSRVGGFFQYANTFGCFLIGTLVLSFISSFRFLQKTGIIIVQTMGIVLTQSRGITIILVLIMVSLLLALEKKKKLYVMSTGLGLLLGQLLLIKLGGVVEQLRQIEITTNASEWLTRLLYYKDGVSMMLRRPWGFGHLGYFYSQREYQTGATYLVKYVHSSLIQFGLDFGIMGMIGIVGFGISGVVIGVKYRKAFLTSNILILNIGSIGIFLHSFIDFDFQFMAIILIVICYQFCIEASYINEKKTKHNEVKHNEVKHNEVKHSEVKHSEVKYSEVKRKDKMVNIFMYKGQRSAYVLIWLIMGWLFVASLFEYQEKSEVALQIYPYYTTAVSQLLNERSIEVKQDFKREVAETFIKKNAYFVDGFAFLRDYYYNSGDLENSMIYAQKVVELTPLWLDNYDQFAIIGYEYLSALKMNGELSKDHELLIKILQSNDYFQRLRQERGINYSMKHKVVFEVSPRLKEIIAYSQKLLESVEE